MTAHGARATIAHVLPLLVLLAAPPARPPDSAFAPLAEKDGVTITIAREPGPHPWIHATAHLDAPVERVAAILEDFDHYRAIFDPFYQKADVLDHGADGSARLHVVWHYPWPFHNRDAIVAYTVEKGADGTVTIRGVDGGRKGDPSSGVRIDDVSLHLVLTPASGGTDFGYEYYGDLGGNFGKSENEKAWRGEAPLIVNAIRRALKPEAAAPSGGTVAPASR